MNDKVWLPAQCLSAEMALIGGVLLDRDNAAFDDVSSIVSAEHFYDVRNQKIWTALSYLLRKGIQVDAVTLAEELQVRGWLGDVGGVLYLAEILEIVPHSSHSEIYARMVREKADERNARYALTEAVRALDNGGIDLHDIIGEVDSRLLELLAPSGSTDDSIASAVVSTVEEIERRMASDSDISGLASGFRDLDRLTTGFYSESVTIFASRPSTGKTAFAGNVATHIAARGKTVLFCSIEQSKTELVERMIASLGKVDAHSLRTGRLTGADQDRVRTAAESISKLPLRIDDSANQTLQQIRSVARRTQRQHGLGVIIIDYLQIITPENRKAPREQQVAEISRGLKALAKEMKCPVIALAQLNRDVERREDKRPKLADLRESGSVEQDADQVIFLHRPDKYDAADRPGIAELIIAKNRNGLTGIVELEWQGQWMRFVDAGPTIPGMDDYRFGSDRGQR